jgi:adenosylcobyric acid synthase
VKAISVLGTSSNSGKSWVATALCALLRRKGFSVAPFKAQNMSNNSFATLTGGEIGRAQAAQAEACGLAPIVEMNPILLKPSGSLGSQLILSGKAVGHVRAGEYYALIDKLWPVVCEALEYWRNRCDVIVLEGAGSPVELNLADRDIVNLRPIHELDGKWLLVADIERGGVFAQIVGTWILLTAADQARAIGVVVNKFRGDRFLFADAGRLLAEKISLPYLGVLPFASNLQPESEDSLCYQIEEGGKGEVITWIRFPHLSNSQDCQPWLADKGVQLRWANKAEDLAEAKLVILPGTKNTMADLEWTRRTGIDCAVKRAAQRGTPIVGICGGYQMLGESISDPRGVAGDPGESPGLNLLPVRTAFTDKKEVRQVLVLWGEDRWQAYEIHMGESVASRHCAPLCSVRNHIGVRFEGCRVGNIWGSYLHGLFESSIVRSELASRAGIKDYQPAATSWRTRLQSVYEGMADLLEEHIDLEGIWRYVELTRKNHAI